jgi:hypothetical protein
MDTREKVHLWRYIRYQRSVHTVSTRTSALSSYSHFIIQYFQILSISRHFFAMKSFTVAFILAALASTVVGDNCRPGLNYCGSSLLSKGKCMIFRFQILYLPASLSVQVTTEPKSTKPCTTRRRTARPTTETTRCSTALEATVG